MAFEFLSNIGSGIGSMFNSAASNIGKAIGTAGSKIGNIGSNLSSFGSNMVGKVKFDNGSINMISPDSVMEGAKNAFVNVFGDGGLGKLKEEFTTWKEANKGQPEATWKDKADAMEKEIKKLEQSQQTKDALMAGVNSSISSAFQPSEQQEIYWQPIDIQVNPNSYREDY